MKTKFLPLLLALFLTACMPAMAPQDFANGTPTLRPERFFAGRTVSTGVLEDRGGAPVRRFTVTGSGRALPDGGFRLDQTIRFEDQPVITRSWVMRRGRDDHHYIASLTGAAGPVTGEVWGNLMHLRYDMETPTGGTMEQWLYLQPDGVTVMNEATIRIFGAVAARLSERITHRDK